MLMVVLNKLVVLNKKNQFVIAVAVDFCHYLTLFQFSNCQYFFYLSFYLSVNFSFASGVDAAFIIGIGAVQLACVRFRWLDWIKSRLSLMLCSHLLRNGSMKIQEMKVMNHWLLGGQRFSVSVLLHSPYKVKICPICLVLKDSNGNYVSSIIFAIRVGGSLTL